ncbi:hypothetical protein M569_16243, partial [Genlisea aurea]
MAIEKNNSKQVCFDPEFNSPHTKDTIMSSDEDIQRKNPASAIDSDDEDEDFDDCDSGAGSDDFDSLELGESGEEFCRIVDQTCSIPYELYDLPGLEDVLSMEVWNEVLTEEDRFRLTKYLPDMDKENYVHTLRELFSGDNIHFGSPIGKLFQMLKGGLCEPRVALYRQGLNFFQRRQHYHNLRKYHNNMVNNICQIRDTWMNCKGYSIDEKLRVLSIVKSRRNLTNENTEEFSSEPSEKDESLYMFKSKTPKDQKLRQKARRYSSYRINPPSDISHGQSSIVEASSNYGKRNPKGALKLERLKTSPIMDIDQHLPPSILPGVPIKPYRNPQIAPLSMNDGILEDDESESIFEAHRVRKLHRPLESAEDDLDGFIGFPAPGGEIDLGVSKNITKSTAKPSTKRSINAGGKKVKSLPLIASGNQMKYRKGQKSNLTSKGRRMDSTEHPELGPSDFPGNNMSLMTKNQQWRIGNEEAANLQDDDKISHIDSRGKYLKGKFKGGSLHNGEVDGFGTRGLNTFSRNDDTESDSSENADENEDDNPFMRSKWAYPGGPDSKKPKLSKKDKRELVGGYSRISGTPEVKKSELKGKTSDARNFQIFPSNDFRENNVTEFRNANLSQEQQDFPAMSSNGFADMGGFHVQSRKSFSNQAKRRNGSFAGDGSSLPQSNYMLDSFEDDLFLTRALAADNGTPLKLDKRSHMAEFPERSDLALMGCGTASKKRKSKDDPPHHRNPQVNDDSSQATSDLLLDNASFLKKRSKGKLDDTSDSLENGVSQPPLMEEEMEDIEVVTKRQKKSFPLITPSVPNNFSFSIIHLLSAVRVAMITLLPDDGRNESEAAAAAVKEELTGRIPDNDNAESSMYPDTPPPAAHPNVSSLTVQEIMNRLRSNPGDPCILETQEPLQDLVRGVLKILSSRTAPMGAKGWKPLVVYEKSKKSWLWVGPVSSNSDELVEAADEEDVISPDSWGVPYKMLVKLVDSFANWLKNSQETLKQIGNLPSPPMASMQMYLDEKDRFKDLRAQKSLSTIIPSPEEVKAYFRKEEELRYQIPDRAFFYTAVDGKKSIVAPLRRGGGKPTSKARDHFMLKRDRPPHVTILCLVRDAASRLPGSIGTRADVCTLIRDSQYIVEDVSDAQVNQVVSGALDRLHYERDPCVQFDSERKLWVYLHREKEEEDFEDDGTSSTKKWKRQKKEAAETGD